MPTHQTGPMDIVGEVVAVDVRSRRFELVTHDAQRLSLEFREDQEDLVTKALTRHRSMNVLIRGHCNSPEPTEGQPLGEVESLTLVPARLNGDTPRKPIWEIFEELSKEAPDEEWDQLPSDLSENHDHYLYGSPRRCG
ncbi:MAG: hypothetical protein GHCLOJNM_02361 [bacterium]|nr:hypothetical protein [bacterium]